MKQKDLDTLLKRITDKADDAAVFSGGAQVVSIKDVREIISPNSLENIARNYSHYYNDTWHFSDEYLKQFVEYYTAKMLEDKEREIAELKTTVKKWQENSVDLEYKCLDKNYQIAALTTSNNKLREALEVCKYDCHTGEVIGIAEKALKATQSCEML